MDDHADLWRLALDGAVAGRSGVLVRTLATAGFGARPAVEAMVVLADGRCAGSILGGRLDRSILDAATDVLGRDGPALRIGITDIASGDGCTGTAEVLLQRLDQLPPRYWAPTDRPDVAVTLLDRPLGATVIVAADRSSVGTLGDPSLDAEAVQSAGALLRAARSMARIDQLGVGHRALFEVRRRAATLVLAGGGDLADAITSFASALEWVVHASADAEIVCEHLTRCGPGDALIVMSHDPALDEPVLARAAEADLGYVGVTGSRHVHRQRHARLRRRGVDDDFIARLRGPAGLDIGAWTPHETAVSILAEVIAERSGRSGRPLIDTTSPIHP